MITLQWNETALEFLHEDIPGSERMVPVFSIHNGEHDWTRMLALFSTATKEFYWTARSGCACCEELTSHLRNVDDLAKGTERELKQAIRGFLEHAPDILKDGEKQKIFSKIKKHK